VDFLQNITAKEWPTLKEEFGIGWEKEAKMIYIRRGKAKSTPATSEAIKIADEKTTDNGKFSLHLCLLIPAQLSLRLHKDSWTKYG